MTSEPGGRPDPVGPSTSPDPQAEVDPRRDGEQPFPEPAAPPDPAAPPEPQVYHLHPAAWFIEAMRVGQSAVLPLVIVAFGSGGATAALAGLFAATVLGAIMGVVVWRTTTYTTDDHRLVLRSGVINKREHEIPAARISALDTSRGVLQRIFGVVEVQVQTPGGGDKAELTLRAVSFAEAERIRQALGHGLTQAAPHATAPTAPSPAAPGAEPWPAPGGPAVPPTPGGAPPPAGAPVFVNASADAALSREQVVYKMPTRDLALAAVTSPSIAVTLAALGGLASQAGDIVSPAAGRDLQVQLEALALTAALALAVAVLVIAAALSIAGTILLYAGFTVTRDERRIRVRRGLLTERFSTIPLDRLHGVRIVESPIRQLLGYASLEVEVAGYAGNTEAVTRTLVPLVPRAAARSTLARIAPPLATTSAEPTGDDDPALTFAGVPARGAQRYLWVALAWATIPALALAIAPLGAARVLAIVPVALALLWGRSAAATAGWALVGRGGDNGTDLLVLRWRGWARSTLIADRARLQRAELLTSPGQRRRALATFRVALSNARVARVRHLEAPTAHQLLQVAASRDART